MKEERAARGDNLSREKTKQEGLKVTITNLDVETAHEILQLLVQKERDRKVQRAKEWTPKMVLSK